MGACALPKAQKRKNSIATQFTPQELRKYQVQNLPQLNFQASISNIKIKKCKYSKVSVKMQIQQIKTMNFSDKMVEPEGVAKWKVSKQFAFTSNQYQLRKKRLIVQISNEQQTIKGLLKLSLFKVATGPYHQDFLINTVDNKDFRISFDFKISQMIEVHAKVLETNLDLKSQYPGDIFTFYVKTIIGNSTWNSEPSYMLRIGLQQQLKKGQKNGKARIKRHESIADYQKVVCRGQRLVWKKQQCADMPQFNIKFPFQQFSSASFQQTFWCVGSSLPNEVGKEDQKMVGSCYFSFNKLAQGKSQSYQINGINFDNYQISLSQDLRQAGQTVGTSQIKLQFSVQEHIKQMYVCVSTQEGILKSSPVFTNQQSSNKELLQLSKNGENIDNKFVELNKMKAIHENTISSEQLGVIRQIQRLLLAQNKLLCYSYKQTIKLYKYGNQNELLKGQKSLLSIGFKLVQYVKQQNEEIANMCWPVITSLMKRGEFVLSNMGFKPYEIQRIQKSDIDSYITKKIEIGVRYQQFLLKLLAIAVNSLNIKGFQQQKKFAEQFIGHAYFRIPRFRSEVLEAIRRESDPQIVQWRGTQFNLNSQQNIEINMSQNTFLLLFDWGTSFHKCLEGHEKCKQNNKKLQEILRNKEWKVRMSKRRGAFFASIGYWVDYIEEITVSIKNIKWQYFPGYNKIIEAFMAQMKITPIQEYSLKMKKAAGKLLANQKLLNVFVAIIFNKANVNNTVQVVKTLELLMQFLSALDQKQKIIPSNFNIMFFYKAMKIIIEGENAFPIAKCLQMLYYYFHLFSIQFQIDIAMYLLGKVFFKLFLHWSQNVRGIFYHLLNYRIYFEAEKGSSKQSILKVQYSTDVKARYRNLLQMLQDLQEEERQNRRRQIVNKFEKQLYKKMKKKLSQRKKQKDTNSNIQPQSSVLQKQMQREINKLKLEQSVSSNGTTYATMNYKLPQFHASSSSNLGQSKSDQVKFRQRSATSSSMILKNLQKMENIKQQGLENQSPVPTFKQSTSISETAVVYFDKSGKKSRKLSLKYNEDIEIVVPTKHQANLVFTAMEQYLKYHQTYQAFVKKNIRALPKVQIQIPIDSSEMRPQSLDQW